MDNKSPNQKERLVKISASEAFKDQCGHFVARVIVSDDSGKPMAIYQSPCHDTKAEAEQAAMVMAVELAEDLKCEVESKGVKATLHNLGNGVLH